MSFLKGGVRPVQSFVLTPTSRHNIWVNNDFPTLGDGLLQRRGAVLNYQPIAVEKARCTGTPGTEVWPPAPAWWPQPLPPP